MGKEFKKTNGITLVALVITIIVMLILAGVVISLTLNENGVISKAQKSGEAYNEQAAREKLELVLLDLQTDKRINPNYNENQYINVKIQEKQMTVSGDIVFVDGWQFQIDRSVPKIVASLGNKMPEEKIQITMNSTISEDFAKATIDIQIAYEKEIVSIIFDGETVEIPEKQEGKYILQKDVADNGIYSVIAKDETGSYNIQAIEVKDLTENMDIYTKEDLMAFVEKVNSGRTFEGKVVKLKADINLNEKNYVITDGKAEFNSDAEKWTVITTFAGTFEGNGHKIKGIYFNTTARDIAMFNTITEKGAIKNLIIEDSYYYTLNNKGGKAAFLVCNNLGTIYQCATSKTCSITVKSTGTVHDYGIGAAGLVYENEGLIQECCNFADITSNKGFGSWACSAGIVMLNYGTILDSYNTGKISTIGGSAYRAGGISGRDYEEGIIKNCYNIGLISSTSAYRHDYIEYGGISGGTEDKTRVYRTNNNFYLSGIFTISKCGNKDREASINATANTTRTDEYGLNENQFLGIEKVDEKDILELLNTRDEKNTRSMD